MLFSGCEPTCKETVGAAIQKPSQGEGEMRGDPVGPPAVWDIGLILGMWVWVHREGTSLQASLRRSAAQVSRPKGDTEISKLLDAHPEFNPNERYAADCVHLGTSSFS